MKEDLTMRRSMRTNDCVSEILEHSVLDTFEGMLELVAATLIEVYPFPDEDLMREGGYEARHAYSRALINQIEALQDTLRCYRRCLEAAPQQSKEDSSLDIPF